MIAVGIGIIVILLLISASIYVELREASATKNLGRLVKDLDRVVRDQTTVIHQTKETVKLSREIREVKVYKLRIELEDGAYYNFDSVVSHDATSTKAVYTGLNVSFQGYDYIRVFCRGDQKDNPSGTFNRDDVRAIIKEVD